MRVWRVWMVVAVAAAVEVVGPGGQSWEVGVGPSPPLLCALRCFLFVFEVK
jgi:hypothetical protein